jgi:hypothetical protein
MLWIRENWFWIVVAVAFTWMHARMHGGHGHHQPPTSAREDRDHGQH